MEDKAIEVIRYLFEEVIGERDDDDAKELLRQDIVQELSLTKKESNQFDKLLDGKKISFLQAMNLLGKALDEGYYLMDDEIEHFDFIFEPKYNRKFRKVKQFIRDYKKFK